MNIGIPKEIKSFEGRVALSPTACVELLTKGHSIFIEHEAGALSGFTDEDYSHAGITVCPTAKQLYEQCELIVKVKEPVGADLDYLTAKHTLFCFLHLAANRELATKLAAIGLTAIAFESVSENNRLVILKPMSEIAGKLAVQIGTTLLHLKQGGAGLLLGGLEAFDHGTIDKGQVLVLGAGSAGTQAALLAKNMGANVFVFDKSVDALALITRLNPAINVLSDAHECYQLLSSSNLLIGALLVPGKETPRFIKRYHLRSMPKGSVAVDISVDQGGCLETTRATTYDKPTFVEEGVTHFCVTNMPGAVPITATQALSALLPDYINRLTLNNWYENDKMMHDAVNIKDGKTLIDI